jgi:cytochrome c oxidase cbb3-type subunit 2
MPSYPYLFETTPQAEAGDVVVPLPPSHAPRGATVVAGRDAQDLVAYLLSLDRGYPVAETPRGARP